MTSRRRHPSRLPPIALLAFVSATVAIAASSMALLDGFRKQAEDLMQPATESTGDVVVVGIDRRTLASIGRSWPWARDVHADLINAIAAGSPRLIVYDVLFADAGDDAALVAAVADVPTVVASALTLRIADHEVPSVVDSVEPIAELARVAEGVGHANVALSTQRGVVRVVPFYALDDRGIVVPSLAAAAVGVQENTSTFVERPDGLQIGKRLVPLDDGALRINYAHQLSTTDTPISAISILVGDVDPSAFTDKVVVVGVTEPTLGDLHLIPTDKSGSTPGVLIHANAINQVLARAWLQPVGTGWEWFVIALAAAVTATVFVTLRLRHAVLLSSAMAALVIAWSSWRFSAAGELWDIVWPIITIALVAATASGYRYVNEIRYRRRAEMLFGQYVPDNVVEDLADPHRLAAALRGKRLEVALLFCDLRGFTPIAGRLDADAVRRLLEHYYDYVTTIVLGHGGTVMQFVGDEVFSVFGAPLQIDSYLDDAFATAVQLIDDVGQLDERLASDGLPALRFGIGIHRGEVLAAHVGTAVHRQYAVIGDPVNVGSRLCSQAGPGEIAASGLAVDGSERRGFRLDAELALKGVAGPVPVYRYRDTTTRDGPD